MTLRKSLVVLALLMFLFCLCAVLFGAPSVTPTAPNTSPNLLLSSRSQLLQSLNKNVQLEGFFVNSSTPILVENLALIGAEKPLPPDKYVPLTGTIPSSLRFGAKVRLAGLLQKPTGELKSESLALRLATGTQPTVLQQPSGALMNQAPLVLPGTIPAIPTPPFSGTRYAILIGGGSDGPNNYIRYWNDLKAMYLILRAAGYSANNIKVAYADGAPYPEQTGMPVDYAATAAGISTAFGYFVPRVTAVDRLYIFVVGQAGLIGAGQSTPVYWGWGRQAISPPMFAAQVDRIANYQQMTIQMSQAYSGAFIPLLTKPKRIIITAGSATAVTYAHPSCLYGHFNYWYLSALRRKLLIGDEEFIVDANSNGFISKTEAYNTTLTRPGAGGWLGIPSIASQRPQFEDNGVTPSHYGPMPSAVSGGDGLIGANSYY
jgi:hypothetical protein